MHFIYQRLLMWFALLHLLQSLFIVMFDGVRHSLF